MRVIWATVDSVEDSSEKIQRVTCRHHDDSLRPAVVYPMLTGHVAVGERVAVNTTAVDLELGTGGSDFVCAREDKGDQPLIDDRAADDGHIMKLRYSPLQRDVRCVEDQNSPWHHSMQSATSLEGLPVVCCGLHSQVIAVAAAARSTMPHARVVYVMTDGASLMAQLSNVLQAAKDAGFVDATITCGQAMGGDFEAVNLHSALLAAKVVADADIIIVGIGPGVVGSDTALGHGGIAQGEAINAAGTLRGMPIAPLRVSFADQRERHVGVSHHTIAALGRIALMPAIIPMIQGLNSNEYDRIEAQLLEADVFSRHRRLDVTVPEIDMQGIDLKTMGRGIADDPSFFGFAFAAGLVAADLARKRSRPSEN